MGKEEVAITLPENLDNLDLPVIHVEIVEQPSENGFRFRYQSEGKNIGCLHGQTSNGPYRTYPKIKIEGYQGKASVVVSCVEENEPYRAHPHKLVGQNCFEGVCKVDVSPDTGMTAVFPRIGIQCTKRREIAKSLALRKENNVDPFQRGFGHMNSKGEMAKINLDSVRLAFQVFIKTGELEEIEWIAVPATVSNVIRNKNGVSEKLKIDVISDNEAPIEGGKKILMFTSKIDKNDIEVHFAFNQNNQHHVLKGHMDHKDVHHQCALSFITPPFLDQKITQKHHAKLYLFRPSDQSTSDPIDFYFQPKTQDDVENMPLAIRYVRKPNRKSHDKNKESKICSGANVIVEKMESSGMSFTERVLKLPDSEEFWPTSKNIPGDMEKMESSGMSFTERVLKLTENDYDIKKEIAPISFNEINSLLKIEESKNISDVLMQSG